MAVERPRTTRIGGSRRTHVNEPYLKGRPMVGSEYLRDLARRCLVLSANCFDLGVAGKLREMSEELSSKAAEIDRRQQSARQSSDERNQC